MWEDLIDGIAENQAILVLGPDAIPYVDGAGNTNTFGNLARAAIKKKLRKDEYTFFRDQNLFYFKTTGAKLKASKEVDKLSKRKDWYPDPGFVKKVIEIPFSVILNLNPDKKLYRSFVRQWKVPQFGYMTPCDPAPQVFKKINAQVNPILFQLAGSVEDDIESTILDFNDVFNILKNMLIQKGSQGFERLNDALKNSNDYVLMGMNMDRWYFQVFLHYIHSLDYRDVDNPNRNIVLHCQATDRSRDLLASHFCLQDFDLDRNHFQELYTACQESPYIRLRPIRNESDNTLGDVRVRLEEEDFYNVFRMLREHSLYEDHREFIEAQAIKYEKAEEQLGFSLITEEQYNTELKEVKRVLLAFVNQQS